MGCIPRCTIDPLRLEAESVDGEDCLRHEEGDGGLVSLEEVFKGDAENGSLGGAVVAVVGLGLLRIG